MNRFLLASLVTALAAGCGGGDRCPGGFACFDGGPAGDAGGDAGGGDAAITALAIEPGDPTLAITGGAPASQTFTLVGTHADGTRETLADATFATPDTPLGALSGATFTARGGGVGTVPLTAMVHRASGPQTASTTITVEQHTTVLVGGTPPDAPDHFASAPVDDPARASHVLYPLDGALLPQNLAPLDVQWDQGRHGDLYRVRLARGGYVIDAYAQNTGDDFGFDWAVTTEAWQYLLAHAAGAPLELRVDRYDATAQQVVSGAPVRVTFAQGALSGAVYYWQTPDEDTMPSGGPALHRIARVDPATGHRDELLPYLPVPPGQPDTATPCVGCHSVSRDGRTLAATLGDGTTAMFDLTANLDANPTPTVYPLAPFATVPRYFYGSFNPDGSRLVVSLYTLSTGRGSGLGMIDPRNGMSVDTTGLPGVPVTSPDWSPDGRTIAVIENGNDSEDGATAGDLAVLSVGDAPDTFGALRVIHLGGDLATMAERGSTDSHTSWSFDSHWLAFQHGPTSISHNAAAGALYLVASSGGPAVRLSAAMGGLDGRSSYWPGFAPFQTDEPAGAHLYWLAFYSRRDYGNSHAGTQGTQRPQLWVTAIDGDVHAGADPSHVPFWLPGQSALAANFAPSWAPQVPR